MYSISSGRFYVYTLAYPSGRVFYVGKGSRLRIHDHEKEARRGIQGHKCDTIRKIWKQGGEVRKEIVFVSQSEQAAYNYEHRLIRSIGVCNLTNVLDAAQTAEATYVDPLASDYHYRIYLRGIPGMTEKKAQRLLDDRRSLRLSQIADSLRTARRLRRHDDMSRLEAEEEQIYIALGWVVQEELFPS